MTGRAFWVAVVHSMRGPTARAADEAIELADSALRTGERLAAETVRLVETLAAERRHSASLTADAAEAVKGALELRATIRRLEGELTTAREQAAVHEAIALRLRAIVLRLRVVLKADPSQDKRNCVALSDQLAENRATIARLEIELGTAQGRDMAPDWHPASQAIVGGLM